ncbi:hypothetical protein EW145_g4376 [Phellinidium pouzarii]|uniref:GDP/GTP exchange factor Sec2 N-terminal domain-containing protein n=1 Tax=Phellinidium pouzarii TaxID=167371 RepID=A0A4S4L3W0_9AGAM|nr:hypothetical protein EW145_g4376 [Phellinidium pouzarii]
MSTKTGTKQRNKLRRRRRPSPLLAMSVVANGIDAGAPIPVSVATSSSPTLHDRHDDKEVMDDAQTQVIASLRAQIQDLISQVTQLNGKLVKSYDRVSDLEDELHVASSAARSSSLKISHLEIERAQHLAALNTGLYVEKEHVTAELTRLMERATDEAAARGQAETARLNIEEELDDLSANLFDQANKMVAEARFGRAMSERKVVDAEMALKSAEEAVGMMQVQMQTLRDEKERTADENARLRSLMEKGKFVEHAPIASPASLKLLNSHAPYQEFLLFIAHLRSVRPSSPTPPHISSILPLPFLARIQTEDSDPTVRLDFAPSLNWLSRRSVLSAIYSGQLTIEPMAASTLFLESSPSSTLQSMIPGSQTGLSCALCGTPLFPTKSEHNPNHPPLHPLSSLSLTRSTSNWSTSLFKIPLSSNGASSAPSPPLTPPPYASNPNSPGHPPMVFVFRLAQSQTPAHPTQGAQRPTNYPLCNSGWCLARLRTTCSLWAFVRAGVIDRVWEEDLSAPALTHAPSVSSASVYSVNSSTTQLNHAAPQQRQLTEKEKAPPLPPRRRSKMSSVGASVGSLWGMASGALRSQPASPVRVDKEKEAAPTIPPQKLNLYEKPSPGGLRVTVPPPLPRRSMGRSPGIRATGSENDEKVVKTDESSSDSPSDAINTEASEKTPIAQSIDIKPLAVSEPISLSNSQSSSAMSTAGDEFTTPVEEFNSSSLSFSIPPTVSSPPRSPRSLRSPRSPHSPAAPLSPRVSRSPPTRSAARLSSPPPPRSPRAVPLPDSRPGTPLKTHSRVGSLGVVVPLSLAQAGMGDGSPSRTGSPAPAGAPPPVPRRAAARRIVLPPSDTSNARQVPESEGHTLSSGDLKVGEDTEPQAIPESKPRPSGDVVRPLPPPLPRRPDHTAQLSVSSVTKTIGERSVSDYGDGDGGSDENEKVDDMHEKQERPREDRRGVDADSPGSFVDEATWEERTWKEIVRLREDMFWARLGGLRV